MCRYRRVNIIYTTCGHSVPQPEQVIPCGTANCIFSPNHGTNCTGDTCRQACWQRFQYPQLYSPNVSTLCPRCSHNSQT